MSKHTKGPWQAIGTDPAEGGDWFWIKAQPHPALRGFSKEIGVVNGGQNDPEQQANARLIASAPELLEAAKAAEKCMSNMSKTAYVIGLEGTSDWDTLAGGADIYGAIDAVRAAIAKAEGAP